MPKAHVYVNEDDEDITRVEVNFDDENYDDQIEINWRGANWTVAPVRTKGGNIGLNVGIQDEDHRTRSTRVVAIVHPQDIPELETGDPLLTPSQAMELNLPPKDVNEPYFAAALRVILHRANCTVTPTAWTNAHAEAALDLANVARHVSQMIESTE